MPPGTTEEQPTRSRAVWIAAAVTIAVVGAGIAIGWNRTGEKQSSPVDTRPGADRLHEAEPAATATIEEDGQSVCSAILAATAPWRAHVISAEVKTVLRRPVIEVATDFSAEQAEALDALSTDLAALVTGLSGPDALPRTYSIQILSAEGEPAGALAFTDARWAIDGPSTPTDAASLYAWLDRVYGSGTPEPEAWFGRVTAIREPATDPDGYVVVATTLDPAQGADQVVAQTIIDAVNSSGATFAPGIRITFADPDMEWTSVMSGVDPYAP